MDTFMSNQLVQKQQVVLTPKMLQELKILQMNSMDLEQCIEVQLTENPLLEIDIPDEFLQEFVYNNPVNEASHNHSAIKADDLDKDFTEYTARPITLKEHLLCQLVEVKAGARYKKVAEYIIQSLDERGYLNECIEHIASKYKIPSSVVQKALRIVQSMDPAGVGARHLKECIIIQLKRMNLLDSNIKNLVLNYLELIADRKYSYVSKKLGISIEETIKYHKIIKGLNPKPGLQFSEDKTPYITPELIAKEMGERYTVIFNDDRIPSLRLNDQYRGLLKNNSSSSEETRYIRAKLFKAIEFINNIERRRQTIISVGTFITDYQREFFEKGGAYLKPLTLKMVANELGVHESTISRAVNGKYIQTPRGIFELKYFFSAGIEAKQAGSISANGVKDIVKRIILSEDKTQPFTDEQVRKILEKKGVVVARRTVAKYREELSILPVSKRKI
ncbi:MAG: RNA polymerase factor sigma-54 [Clostridia bacterium]|nr:RNA polymerase factor sigma-54 [Clostridia bacterium]